MFRQQIAMRSQALAPMLQLRQTMRAQMLAALTPEHRRQLDALNVPSPAPVDAGSALLLALMLTAAL